MSNCTWTLVGGTDTIYDTSCKHTHEFVYQGISENFYKYCPYCGRPVSEDKQ